MFRYVVRFAGALLVLASAFTGPLMTAQAEEAATAKTPAARGQYIVTFKNYGKNSGRLILPHNRSTEVRSGGDSISLKAGRDARVLVLRGKATLRTVAPDGKTWQLAADEITLTMPNRKW